jgi:hypothetical protein
VQSILTSSFSATARGVLPKIREGEAARAAIDEDARIVVHHKFHTRVTSQKIERYEHFIHVPNTLHLSNLSDVSSHL